MFRMLPPPIIRSAYNCIYSIWYLSHRYCYLPAETGLSVLCCAQHTQTSSNSSTIAAGSSNCMTNTRCCRYSCLRSWWWVEVPPETCRAVPRYNKLCNVASYWIYIGIQLFSYVTLSMHFLGLVRALPFTSGTLGHSKTVHIWLVSDSVRLQCLGNRHHSVSLQ